VKLGDWLVAKGKIDREQLERALQDQQFFGERLGTSLIKLGFVSEDTLGEYLADISNSQYAPPHRLENIPSEVISAVPARLAARYRIVPIAIKGRKLQLAMRDPKDLITLDEITFLTGLTIEPFVATEFRIVRAIEVYYGIKLGTKTIPVSGGSPSERRPEAHSRPEPEPDSLQSDIGLDGLPMDAEATDLDQPFVQNPAAPLPRGRESEEEIPASLEEWRMAQQQMPEELPEKPRRQDETRPMAPIASASSGSPPAAETPASTQKPATAPVASIAYHPAVHTMESVAARMRASETRDEVFDAILDFASARFHRAALFVVQQDRVLGWSGRGPGISPLRIRNVMVPLDKPSLFVFFRSGGDYYYGPVPDLPANARLFLDLGFPAPARVLLVPLTIKDRPSVILYADRGSNAGRAPEIAEFRRLLQKASLALEVLILRNKIMMI
jgi:hypothetical protein